MSDTNHLTDQAVGADSSEHETSEGLEAQTPHDGHGADFGVTNGNAGNVRGTSINSHACTEIQQGQRK